MVQSVVLRLVLTIKWIYKNWLRTETILVRRSLLPVRFLHFSHRNKTINNSQPWKLINPTWQSTEKSRELIQPREFWEHILLPNNRSDYSQQNMGRDSLMQIVMMKFKFKVSNYSSMHLWNNKTLASQTLNRYKHSKLMISKYKVLVEIRSEVVDVLQKA